ncbi:MAG: hypothetical protein ACI4WH_08010, partial [Oscillospiraceae bacterium]
TTITTTTPEPITTTLTTTTPEPTTTTIITDDYISLPVVVNSNGKITVNLSQYLGKIEKLKVTFSDKSNSNGAVCFYSSGNWYGQTSYNCNGSDTITIDMTEEYNKATTGEVVFWYNQGDVTVEDISILLEGGVEVTTTTTTTTSSSTEDTDSNYIPVTLKDGSINVTEYTSKDITGVTFKLTGVSSGSGACHLKDTNGSWLGSVNYAFTNDDTVTVTFDDYSNVGTISIYMWWNSTGQTITDVKLITG